MVVVAVGQVAGHAGLEADPTASSCSVTLSRCVPGGPGDVLWPRAFVVWRCADAHGAASICVISVGSPGESRDSAGQCIAFVLSADHALPATLGTPKQTPPTFNKHSPEHTANRPLLTLTLSQPTPLRPSRSLTMRVVFAFLALIGTASAFMGSPVVRSTVAEQLPPRSCR